MQQEFITVTFNRTKIAIRYADILLSLIHIYVIYVKTFMPEKTDEKKFEEELKKFKKQTSLENEESTEVYNSNFMKSQKQTSRSLHFKP